MKKIIPFLISAILIGTIPSKAQSYKAANETSTLSVLGTSTLHDWKINAEKIEGSASIEMSDKTLSNIAHLELIVPVADMHSGLDAMDNHMHTALSINNSNSIKFKLVKTNKISPNSIGGYTIQADGELTIANNTKPVQLQATMEIKNNIIRFFGETLLEMTTFGVSPPSAEMGSIQTENGVKIVFDVTFNKN